MTYPTFRVDFPTSGRRVVSLELPWVKGKTLKAYFREPQVKQTGVVNKRVNGGYHMTNQRHERLRLTSVPHPGDEIMLIPSKLRGRG